MLWVLLKRYGVPVLGVMVLAMLLSHAHKIDWAGAWAALKGYPHSVLFTALAFATASHVLYGCYDLIGREHTHHELPRLQTWAVAVSSYAFNLNLGSLVGGVALRARLYARAGLDEGAVAQVIGLSLATNWLGYGLLAGGLFASGAITPPSQAHISALALRVVGALMLLLAAGYIALCAATHGRSWTVRGRKLQLPSARLAVAQLALSTANWALMGATMYFLLGQKVPYATTQAVLMCASIVGVITPIPAGLGVLEAVYIALLSGTVGQGTLMGAVLAYRAVYYLLPLGGGLLLYVALERYAAGSAQKSSEKARPRPSDAQDQTAQRG
ncbi:lysylphosphatidylglycerol synthase domain-containing protein [soil metagenome]